jgi:MFS family permease
MIILPEITPDHQKKYIAGIVGLVLASAGVLGPVLGGILTNYASWRWVFWIKSVTLAETLFPPCLTHHTDTTASGPIGGFSLLVFLLAWPDKKYLPSLERRSWKDVDFVGAFLL